ncbi:MAG: autotransporter-associated beta strand repeat-containing protein [Verrucomicrobia bacterium]|nr:autotransporter-associated beta strand repeat-containing protein [Verrucomicrobiota bacterium]
MKTNHPPSMLHDHFCISAFQRFSFSSFTPFARGAALLAAVLALAGGVQAADGTWTGLGSDTHWNTGGNWLSGSQPGDWANVTFDSNTVNGTVALDNFNGRGAISLNSGLATDITFINGNFGSFLQASGNGGITIAADSKDLTLTHNEYALWGGGGDGSVHWNIGAGRTLTLNCPITYSNCSIAKDGVGTAVINGAGNYATTTAINGGTLQVGVAGALGNGGNVTFGGGTLQYGTGITTDLSSRIKNSTAAVAIDDNGQTITFAGALDSSNTGGLTKSGSGTLTLTASNTYTGATTINAGTLKLAPVLLVKPTAATAESYYSPDNRSPGTTINGSGMTPGNPVTTSSTCGNQPGSNMWLSNGHTPTWITFDLGSVQTVTGFHLWNYNETGTNEIKRGINSASLYMQDSLTGGAGVGTKIQDMTFRQANASTSYTGADYTFDSPVTAQYIEIYANSNFPGADGYTGISEIRFFTPVTTGTVPGTVLSIAAGATLDVSALTDCTLGSGAPLTASGTSASPATIKGGTTVGLGSNAVTLNYTPTSFAGDTANPALTISQGALTLNGAITVNIGGSTLLESGTYRLISQASGSISGTPTLAGVWNSTLGNNGLASGTSASIEVTGGEVNLVVATGPLTVAVTGPTNSQVFLTGTSIPATALAGGGTPNYSVTYHYKLTGAGSYTDVGPVGPFDGSSTFAQVLGTLAAGTYQIYATATDNASGTATSPTVTFRVKHAASVSGAWNDTATWGGVAAPTSADDVIIGSGVAVTVPAGVTAACNSLTMSPVSATTSLVLADATSSLTVSGDVLLDRSTTSSTTATINVGAGTFTAGSLTLGNALATTGSSRWTQLLISTGTATITGNLTTYADAARITFSGAGTLNLGGTVTQYGNQGAAGGTMTFTAATGTVNYDGSAAQTVAALAYHDLTLSGSDAKAMGTGVTVANLLTVAPTGSVFASLANSTNFSISRLTLGTAGQVKGTWGSTASTAATNTNDTYFDVATNGMLTVALDTSPSAKDLLSFAWNGNTGVIDEIGQTVVLYVPHATDVTTINPTCTVSATASVSPASSANAGFTHSNTTVTYTVKAQDNSTKDYQVTVIVSGWTYAAWTGDADSGISDSYLYTAAVNCNGSAVTVNGVSFQTWATSGANFSLSGTMVGVAGQNPNITGDSHTLASSFIYGGTPRTVTLTNLTPGVQYETSFFAFGWEAAGSRVLTFATGSDSSVIDQDAYGNTNGIRISHVFTADVSGTKTFTIAVAPGYTGTFHMSALANRTATAVYQANITSFTWTDPSDSHVYTGVINESATPNPTITLRIPHTNSLNPLNPNPVFTKSPGAACDKPSGGTGTYDFTDSVSTPVIYQVDSGDSAITKYYDVTITANIANPGEILPVPVGLQPGDQYRLVFVTSGTRDATSASIADYNTFVAAAATAVPALNALATTWTCIGSTGATNANANTLTRGTDPSAPIYNLAGWLVAGGNTALWNGSLAAPVSVAETGATITNDAWTGTGTGGSRPTTWFLGDTSGNWVAYGSPSVTGGNWVYGVAGHGYKTEALSLYAISGIITVPAAGGYATWAHDYAGDGVPNEDYNNDGVANGVAFFMGMDGLATNPGVVNGTVTWPYLNEVTSFEVQVSDNLIDWAPAAAEDLATTLPPGGQVTYTLPPGAAKKFCRLMVVP